MRITIEFDDAADLESLLEVRDELVQRIAALENEPLRFSLGNLARLVADDMPSLTPVQRNELRARIEKGV